MPAGWEIVDRTLTVGSVLARRADGIELIVDGVSARGVYRAHAWVAGVRFALRTDETFGCMVQRIDSFWPREACAPVPQC
jgi:hypothetical protein